LKRRFVQQRDDVDLLTTLPGVGWILATVLALEIGDIQRFNQVPELASYAGTVPRVHSSGGKTRYGRVHPDVNRYLKWALVEAGNLIVMQQQRLGDIRRNKTRRRNVLFLPSRNMVGLTYSHKAVLNQLLVEASDIRTVANFVLR
jgi:transposase